MTTGKTAKPAKLNRFMVQWFAVCSVQLARTHTHTLCSNNNRYIRDKHYYRHHHHHCHRRRRRRCWRRRRCRATSTSKSHIKCTEHWKNIGTLSSSQSHSWCSWVEPNTPLCASYSGVRRYTGEAIENAIKMSLFANKYTQRFVLLYAVHSNSWKR